LSILFETTFKNTSKGSVVITRYDNGGYDCRSELTGYIVALDDEEAIKLQLETEKRFLKALKDSREELKGVEAVEGFSKDFL
jgi:hypothetical protein